MSTSANQESRADHADFINDEPSSPEKTFCNDLRSLHVIWTSLAGLIEAWNATGVVDGAPVKQIGHDCLKCSNLKLCAHIPSQYTFGKTFLDYLENM